MTISLKRVEQRIRLMEPNQALAAEIVAAMYANMPEVVRVLNLPNPLSGCSIALCPEEFLTPVHHQNYHASGGRRWPQIMIRFVISTTITDAIESVIEEDNREPAASLPVEAPDPLANG
jgi:hypothetical protein